MFKKTALVIISVILCLSLSLGVSASGINDSSAKSLSSVNSQVQPRYNYTSAVTTSLDNSNGSAKCIAYLCGYYNTTTKISITMTLQKKSLLWWSEVEEWTMTVSDYYATLSKTHSVESGKYRVKAVYKVYSGSASETITDYSTTVEF